MHDCPHGKTQGWEECRECDHDAARRDLQARNTELVLTNRELLARVAVLEAAPARVERVWTLHVKGDGDARKLTCREAP